MPRNLVWFVTTKERNRLNRGARLYTDPPEGVQREWLASVSAAHPRGWRVNLCNGRHTYLGTFHGLETAITAVEKQVNLDEESLFRRIHH